MTRIWVISILCSLLASASAARPADADACTAHIATNQTSRFRINGHASALEPDVCEWLGISYASAPVGELRFAPPVHAAYGDHPGAIEAEAYGYDCPQAQASFVNQLNHTQSEDCLTLNVWSKPGGNATKPVVVFIYGGRFSAGSSHTPFYEGSLLANAEDVVVVTFNFRTDIFGFPGSPEATQNLGFLDQYAAVSWVHRHIAWFGGDPSRITIVGQSSGAFAVSNWAYAFEDRPIVAAMAAHSGTVLSFATNSAAVASASWYNVTSTLGCGSSGDTLACMRRPEITPAQILAAAKLAPTPPGSSVTRPLPTFQATEDNSTVFPLSEYVARLRSGRAMARVPYLSLVNDHESGLYRIPTLASSGVSLPESNWTAFELESFTCPSAVESFWKAKTGIPTYRGRHMADWDNLRLYDPPSSGAYHGSEFNSLLGNSDRVSGLEPSPQQAELTSKMQRIWASFADDPFHLHAMWPRYAVQGQGTLLLGVNSTAGTDVVPASVFDAPCPSLGLDFWDDEILN